MSPLWPRSVHAAEILNSCVRIKTSVRPALPAGFTSCLSTPSSRYRQCLGLSRTPHAFRQLPALHGCGSSQEDTQYLLRPAATSLLPRSSSLTLFRGGGVSVPRPLCLWETEAEMDSQSLQKGWRRLRLHFSAGPCRMRRHLPAQKQTRAYEGEADLTGAGNVRDCASWTRGVKCP